MAVEMQARVAGRLHTIAGAHRDQMVAVVSHADPMRAALAYFLGAPLDFMLRFEVHPASLSVLELADWGAKVLCVNDRSGELNWSER